MCLEDHLKDQLFFPLFPRKRKLFLAGRKKISSAMSRRNCPAEEGRKKQICFPVKVSQEGGFFFIGGLCFSSSRFHSSLHPPAPPQTVRSWLLRCLLPPQAAFSRDIDISSTGALLSVVPGLCQGCDTSMPSPRSSLSPLSEGAAMMLCLSLSLSLSLTLAANLLFLLPLLLK